VIEQSGKHLLVLIVVKSIDELDELSEWREREMTNEL